MRFFAGQVLFRCRTVSQADGSRHRNIAFYRSMIENSLNLVRSFLLNPAQICADKTPEAAEAALN